MTTQKNGLLEAAKSYLEAVDMIRATPGQEADSGLLDMAIMRREALREEVARAEGH